MPINSQDVHFSPLHAMTLRIHGIPASRAIRPLWVATELGLNFDHVMTDYKGGHTRTPEFLALNPNGHIPVLTDDTPAGPVVVWESMACTLYIAKAHGRGDGSDRFRFLGLRHVYKPLLNRFLAYRRNIHVLLNRFHDFGRWRH